MSWRRNKSEVITEADLRRVRVRLNRSEWAQGMTREEIAAKYDRNPDRLAGVVVSLLERLDAIGDDLRFQWVNTRKEAAAAQNAGDRDVD